MAGLTLFACDDNANPLENINPIARPDMGQTGLNNTSTAQELTIYCAPGTRRCLTEQGPQYERCDAAGQLWQKEKCDTGQMCRNGECVQFSCVPGRPICVGPKTQAICDETGRQVRDVATCKKDDVCRGGQCVSRCEEAARRGSYIGCEYLGYKLFNLYERQTETKSPYAIVMANPDPFIEAKVTIRAKGGRVATLKPSITLAPSGTYQLGKETTITSAILTQEDVVPFEKELAIDLALPPQSAGVFMMDEKHGRGPFSITTSQPTIAYQFSPYCCNFTASNDASLLLPRQKLGKRYRAIGYPTFSVGTEFYHAYLTLIAPIDVATTNVQVSSPVPLVVSDSYTIRGGEGQKEFNFSLQAGETKVLTVQYPGVSDLKDRDLSGTRIITDADITLFSGHPCTFIPFGLWACDHLQSQIPPAETLGTNYILTSIRSRNSVVQDPPTEGVYWRLSADEEIEIETTPSLKGLTLLKKSTPSTTSCVDKVDDSTGRIKLKEGETCEVGLQEVMALESSGPLILAGFLSGHQSTGIRNFGKSSGDPAMFIMPPVEQFREDYSFVTPPTFKKSYITIAAPKGTPVLFDGQFIKDEEQIEVQDVTLRQQQWEIYQVAVTTGVHTLSAERRFGLIVYAYDDYVSYAFPGGLNLRPRIKE